jgi:glycosyltransferase involved in cell wall biosynthesis
MGIDSFVQVPTFSLYLDRFSFAGQRAERASNLYQHLTTPGLQSEQYESADQKPNLNGLAKGALRVLLVGQGAPGGLGRYEVHLHAALGVLARSYGIEHKGLFGRRFPEYLFDDLDGSPHWNAGGNRVALAGRLLREVLAWQPDILLFTHVNLAPLGLLARVISPRVRYAVSAHGTEVWTKLSPIRRMALRHSHRVLAVSQYTGDMARRYHGVAKDRIMLLPNALDVEKLTAQATQQGPTQDNELSILSVGRMDASEGQKGVDTVIRALAHVAPVVPNLQYWVVGEGDDLPRLRALAAEVGVSDRVSFLGTVDNSVLGQLYQRCTLFAMPSAQEGFGIVFLEAMAFAKPVIAARAGGAPEVVEDGGTGILVEYGDVSGLSAALSRLLANPELCRAYGQAGYERLHANFTLGKFVDRLRYVLASLVAMD